MEYYLLRCSLADSNPLSISVNISECCAFVSRVEREKMNFCDIRPSLHKYMKRLGSSAHINFVRHITKMTEEMYLLRISEHAHNCSIYSILILDSRGTSRQKHYFLFVDCFAETLKEKHNSLVKEGSAHLKFLPGKVQRNRTSK